MDARSTGPKYPFSVWRVVGAAIKQLDTTAAETAEHSVRVALLSVALARQLGLPTATVRLIQLGGLLHDIGKVTVPDTLLNKPAPLTPDEYRRIMTHTTFGARIVAPLGKRYPTVLSIVRWHHERVDGLGLPDGLCGHAIPLAARVVAVADAFDAMTSARPYRPAPVPSARALLELERGAGMQFDISCVGALRRAWLSARGEAGLIRTKRATLAESLAALLKRRGYSSQLH